MSSLGWLDKERELLSIVGPIEAMSQTLQRKKQPNQILQCSKATWIKVHKILYMSQYKHMYSSIWNNPSIKIGRESFVWFVWLNNIIISICDLYVDGMFQSFEELKQKFNVMDKASFWTYLQLRSCMTDYNKCAT